MADDNQNQSKDNKLGEQTSQGEVSDARNKPANPEMDAVAANQSEPTADPEVNPEAVVDKAKEDLDATLEKAKEEKAAEDSSDASEEEMHPAAPEEPMPEGEQAPEEAPASEPEEKKEEPSPEASAPSEKPATEEAEKPAEPVPTKAEGIKVEGKKEAKKKEPVAPKKIGKEKGKRKSNAKFLVSMGLGFVFLFIAFIVLMVLVIAGGGEQSGVLTAFGIDAAGIKGFLLVIVNLSFGFLALLFFVLAVIGVFRLLIAKKKDKEAKKKGVKMSILGIVPLVFVMFIWLFLFNFIGGIEIAAERVRAEILVLEPTNLEGLQAPLEVTFSSENVIIALQNQGLTIVGASWDLDGDGLFETEPTEFVLSYLYNRRGNYNVGLSVTVAEEEAPRQFFFPLPIGEALFAANPSTGTAPLEVAFDASDILPVGKKIQSLDWDFDGDGTYELTGEKNIRPRHTFEQIGTFAVHLRIVDENNLVENYYRDIEIVLGDRPLISAFIDATPGLTGVIPLQIRFDGGDSESLKGNIINYEWDFGDGSDIQIGRSVSYVYNDPGIYQVTLTVQDDFGKEATKTAEVEAKTISSEPEARFQTVPAATEGLLTGTLPFVVRFDGSGSVDADDDIVDYEWDFGTGSTSTGQNASHTFEEAGSYTVTLTVRDSQSQESTASLSVTVEEPGVKSVIIADPQEGNVPLTIDFDGSSSSAFKGQIVSYEWDFGDGTPSTITSARISHKYNNVGTFTVKLKVVTNQNELAEGELMVYIREIPLRACFEPSRHSGIAPLAVTFDSKCSTGAVATYSWDFGDGKTADVRKPAHEFIVPGTYNVTLEVADDKNNVNSFSDVIVVEGELQ